VLDRREDGLEAIRAGRGAQHNVDVGMRGDRDETLTPAQAI